MANSSINLVDLDFNALKTSFKDHLASQARYRDYNFDGSNINVLLDVLAYNSYLNTFYLNMVASEMFLDTAQLRDSVVSHAKELNYLPRSFKSAYANVNISITPSTTVDSVEIPSKTSFTSRVGSNTYNFVTNESVVITTSNSGVFYANSITLYEGVYVTDTFVKNSTVDGQRFVLTNPNVDTSSVEITVTENSGADVSTFVQSYSMFGLTPNSSIFFVQAAESEQYEIVFGDNTSGRSPLDGAVIEVTYRVCNGELPNGADTFVNNSSIDGHSDVSVTLNREAINGSIPESIQSIKYNAPRSFQSQERAVTESDYRTLLTREFPEIQAISVFGGEKEDPPQYGKVFVSVDITDSDGVPDVNKNLYKSYLQDKVPLGITVEIVDPDFVYLSIETDVKYDYTSTTLSAQEIKTIVTQSIIDFNNTYLNDFNAKFRFSNFVSYIDAADSSIINNDTVCRPYFLLSPTLNTNNEYSLSFNSEVLITTPTSKSHDITTDRGIYSTNFVYGGLKCQLEDDGAGSIRIVRVTDTAHIEVLKVGTIDYTTGAISINNLNVSSFTGNGIKLFAKLVNTDFESTLKYILAINTESINVTATPSRP
jgi:hypothetical protein